MVKTDVQQKTNFNLMAKPIGKFSQASHLSKDDLNGFENSRKYVTFSSNTEIVHPNTTTNALSNMNSKNSNFKPDLPGRVSFSKNDVYEVDYSDHDNNSEKSLKINTNKHNNQNSNNNDSFVGVFGNLDINNQCSKKDETQMFCCAMKCNAIVCMDTKKTYSPERYQDEDESNQIIEDFKREIEQINREHSKEKQNTKTNTTLQNEVNSDQINSVDPNTLTNLKTQSDHQVEHLSKTKNMNSMIFNKHPTLTFCQDNVNNVKCDSKNNFSKPSEKIETIQPIVNQFNNDLNYSQLNKSDSFINSQGFHTNDFQQSQRNENYSPTGGSSSSTIDHHTNDKTQNANQTNHINSWKLNFVPFTDTETSQLSKNDSSLPIISNYLKVTNQEKFLLNQTNKKKLGKSNKLSKDNKNRPITGSKPVKPISISNRIVGINSKSKGFCTTTSQQEETSLNEFQIDKVESWMSVNEFNEQEDKDKCDSAIIAGSSLQDVEKELAYNQTWRETPSSKTDDEGNFSFEDQLECESTYDEIVSVIKEIDEQKHGDDLSMYTII